MNRLLTILARLYDPCLICNRLVYRSGLCRRCYRKMSQMSKAFALFLAGLILISLSTSQLIQSYGHLTHWYERVAIGLGAITGYFGITALYRWWSTRP